MSKAFAVTCMVAAISCGAFAADAGLLAHYTFAEGTGAVLKDHSGNGFDGNIHGATWVKTDAGTALSFKPGQYVDLGARPEFNLPGDRAIAVWVKLAATGFPDGTTNWVIVDGGDAYPNSGYMLRIDGDSAMVSYRHCAENGRMRIAISRQRLENNKCYFLVISRQGNKGSIYIDGALDSQFDLLDSDPAKRPFSISATDQSFAGVIDDVAFYKRALTTAEIIAMFQQGAPRHGKDATWIGKIRLTPYCHYDEGTVLVEADFAGILPLQAGQQASVAIGLPGQPPAKVEAVKTMPDGGRCEFTFAIKDLPAGKYQLTAFVKDADDKTLNQCSVPLALPYEPVAVASPAERVVAALPAPPAPVPYRMEIGAGGGFIVKVGNETYPMESSFSWPNGDYNLLGAATPAANQCETGWKPVVHKLDDRTFHVSASGRFYTVERTISLLPTHINVQDKLTNKTGDAIAVLFKHSLNTAGRGIATGTLAGAESSAAKNDTPLQSNPTIFLRKPGLGIGLIALDDVFIVQSKGDFSPECSRLYSSQLALDKNASYTLEWSLYLNSSGDYYDFINQVRKDEDRNGKADGGMALYHDRNTGRFGVPTAEYFKLRNIKYINCTSMDHPVDDPQITLEGIEFLKYPKELARTKEQIAAIHKIRPDAMVMFHIAHSLYSNNKPEQTFPDSRVIKADGKQAIYYEGQEGGYFSNERKKEGWRWYSYYPTLDNSFGRELMRSVDVMMDEMGCNGAFMDGFMIGYGGEYTYDRWDGHTADIDPATKTIKRKVGSVLLLSQDALVAFSRKMRDKGGQVVANNSVITRTVGRETYIIHDKELVEGPSTHLAPTSITLSNAYNFTNEKEFYYDSLNKLNWGSLAFYYGDYPNAGNDFFTRQPMVAQMFPMTFEEIHSGCVKGKERIVTSKSGVYGWKGDSSLHFIYRYDALGWRIPAGFLTTVDGSGARTEVNLTEKQAAVVVKTPVQLRSDTPVNAILRSYDAGGITLGLNGKGEAQLSIVTGDFAVKPGAKYVIKLDKEMKVAADRKGLLRVNFKLNGPVEVRVAAVAE